MVLTLLPDQLAAIRAHAESTYPEECCGLLLGQLTIAGKTLVEVLPAENTWNAEAAEQLSAEPSFSKELRYAIAPQFLLNAQRDARDRNLSIIGIYHSHTDHPAIPSECDRQYAWPQYSYIIVSVEQGKAADLRSWSLDRSHQFQPEEIATAEPIEIKK